MAEELQFPSRTDSKRKYEDETSPPPPPPSSAPRRVTGFSAPITSPSPDTTPYTNAPLPLDEIQLAKKRAQEIAARLFSNAEAKRPRPEIGGPTDNFNDKGFSSAPIDFVQKPHSSIPVSYGFHGGSSKKIDIPNGRVGNLIGKGGETIKNLQLQSGAKIQVTRDMDADPNSLTRLVELVGSPEQISKAEQLINDILAEAEAGGSGQVARRFMGQGGAEQFSMKVPNNKVGLIIGKGGETIKNMQARSGARIQLIPLHPPPGYTSMERTVYIDGTEEQIESAKQLVNEVISENRARNPPMGGTYPQQGYRPPQPPTSWGPPGPPPVQQPGYGYIQPGAYPAPPPQYDTSQPTYAGYPPQPTSSGWDQTPIPPSQQTTQGSGYDYYSQHPPPGGSSTQDDTTGYNYHQAPASNYNQQQGSHGAPNYSQPPPSGQQQGGYLQPGYDQLQGYNSAPSYGTGGVNSTQDISPQGWPTQVPPAQPPPTMQGYTGQQPNTTPTSYPSQGPVPPTQSGYPSTSPPPGYGSQQPTGTSYVQSSPVAQPNYGPPQGQKPPSQAVYGQTPPSNSQGGYIQGAAVQPGYSHSQHQSAQPALGSAAPQQGYVQQPYGVPPTAQPGYGQQQPYGESYDGGYSQPLVPSSDRTVGGNVRGSIDAVAPGTQSVQQNGVSKASPPS